VSPGDAERWISLGVPESAVEVTGDPRHDEVLEQTTDLGAIRLLAPWAERGPTLVAGSVEPEDEAMLVDAFVEVLKAVPDARLLIVPHDPTVEAAGRIMAAAKQAAVASQVLDGPEEPVASCIILPRRGVLSSLYTLGKLSYVGGGFRRRGLHAVIEPAALGVPVIVGPDFGSSIDARTMISTGGGVALPREDSSKALAECWGRWLGDGCERNRAGEAARKVLVQGAAGNTARHLLSLLAR